MTNDEWKNDQALGAQPSIVQLFEIEGLYGYRNVSLNSDHAATILIAKNGAGKTTLLGALAAFLKGQFGRLSEIEFNRIRCKLRGLDEIICLNYADVLQLITVDNNDELNGYAKKYGLDPSALVDYIDNEYPLMRLQYTSNHPVFEAIRMKVASYSSVETKRILDRLSALLAGRSPNTEKIKAQIQSIIGGFEIVYLPTYRRVEVPLSRSVDEGSRTSTRKKPSLRNLLGVSSRSIFDAEIEFGLSDISARLSELNQEILVKSNQGYREISANIINELIENEFENVASDGAAVPAKEALSLFLSRLKDGRRMGPYGDVVIPNIDKIYNREQISYESNRFLTYFLSKLTKVIDTTRDIERMVEDFISSCNRYLSSQDMSTRTRSEISSTSQFQNDDKVLRLDRRTLRVSVESVVANRRISLDALSSGEKQMISLFARLYLYQGKKIILIDEPELSLSLDWQRKILMDVLRAPSCVQVIAITHSPFVFENALEPFARSLNVSLVEPKEDSTEPLESDIDDYVDGDELNG